MNVFLLYLTLEAETPLLFKCGNAWQEKFYVHLLLASHKFQVSLVWEGSLACLSLSPYSESFKNMQVVQNQVTNLKEV